MQYIHVFNFSEYGPELYEKIVYTDIGNIGTMVLLEIDTKNAYVMLESRAENFILSLNHINMKDGPIFRLMKEPICKATI